MQGRPNARKSNATVLDLLIKHEILLDFSHYMKQVGRNLTVTVMLYQFVHFLVFVFRFLTDSK